MPATPVRLNASPNMSQAIRAVVGGVRYNRLVTLVAALFRINANSRKIAPMDNARMDHSKAPTKRGVHYTVCSSGVRCSNTIASGSTTAKDAANWISVPVRRSN